MSITIVGSVGLDTVETPFGSRSELLGGAAVYASIAANLFTQTRIVGIVGKDFPEEHLAFLRAAGVDLEGLQVKEGLTFRWSGRYEYDLNVRHTLDTQLNLFSDFHPVLPEGYRGAPYLFLANIDPELQLEVLTQARPRLSMMDTMDYWIEGKRRELDRVISAVDIVLMNDFEMRQYCGHYSLVEGARKVLAMGPQAVIVKKGEHGAILVTAGGVFLAPAYPLGEVRDPTGAGDTFAGGFLGYLAESGDTDEGALRRAIVHGSVVASFVVEDFSLDRLKGLSKSEIAERYAEFQRLIHYEEACLSLECPLRPEELELTLSEPAR